ncbi:protein YgfX [Thalassotalea nanhaiensis]|uniref:Protein YgfX n=1 Tax=Thalassotalea nanhaiensis TaxID=3065648 RepID=A0ABY9TKP0_9GAMM|nr:protein YgfX [Colwelliaceae bacterium SQ345]
MKPSTQWCKLYSIESKYSFTLQKSTLAKQVPYFLAGLIFIVLIIILANFGLHLSYQTIFVCSAITALCTFTLARFSTLNTFAITAFVISDDGIITLAADKKYLLTKGCLVYSFGCALSLTEITPQVLNKRKQNKRLNRFIFKDELKEKDYRRLCRIVLRRNSLKER